VGDDVPFKIAASIGVTFSPLLKQLWLQKQL
jgi:hypothetical protein